MAPKGQHVHAGAPGYLGGFAAQCCEGVGEAGAVHVNAQSRVLRNPGQVLDLGGGVDRAGLGGLGEAQHGGLHAVHVTDLAVHCRLQLIGVDLRVFTI